MPSCLVAVSMFKRFRWRGATRFVAILLLVASLVSLALRTPAQGDVVVPTNLPRVPDRVVNCELLVAGGGIAGVATAYEALQAGRTVCLTDITDWVGGQLTSQGTSALDEAKKQRAAALLCAWV